MSYNNDYQLPPLPPPPKDCCPPHGCSDFVTQFADVSVPVLIKPETKVGPVQTECCGAPEVCCACKPGKDELELLITQKIVIKVPVRFCADTCVGPTEICCAPDCDCPHK